MATDPKPPQRQHFPAAAGPRDGARLHPFSPRVRSAESSHLACVIPMHNEGGHAERFLRELHAVLAPRFDEVTLIVVDDGSRDSTADEVLRAIRAGVPVHLITLSRNFGKEIALTAGLEAAETLERTAHAVLIIDADFQHPFRVIPQMIRRWEAGIDMAYGVQRRRESCNRLRTALTWLFYRLMRSTADRITIPPDAGDFRLLDRRVVAAINRLPERNRYMKGLYAWVGFTSEGVPFEAAPRPDGKSSFGLGGLSRLAFDGLTAFTSWPLRVALIVGVAISMAAFAYGSWIIIERIWIGQPIPGFATLAAALMFFSGIQLISIGLLGEYIGRIFIEVKGRPLYVVSQEIGGARRSRAPTVESQSSSQLQSG